MTNLQKNRSRTKSKQGTILHLFGWDKKFLPHFWDLIQKNFKGSCHRLITYNVPESEKSLDLAGDVIYINPIKDFLFLSHALYQADKIILHGLFNNHLYYILSLNPWCLHKCYWVIWGGDLYNHQLRQKDWRWWKNWVFRKFVLGRIRHFITYVKGDFELAQEWYNVVGEWHDCLMYPSNTFQAPPRKWDDHAAINILIGNSADPNNHHFSILNKLTQYKEENISLFAPLPYGDMDYAAKVITEGKKIFGAKFTPLTNLIPFDEYYLFLQTIDIAIFNHNRQQGMGNTITLLGLGKKVYMRQDVMSARLFHKLGIKVFDVDYISLEPIPEDVREQNIGIVKNYFSEKNLIRQWQQIFDSK